MQRIVLLLTICFFIQFASAQNNHEESGEVQHDTSITAAHEEDTHSDENSADEAISPELQERDKKVKAGLDEFPNLHPLVVHFPVVLLLLGVFLQLIQIFKLNRNLDWVILLCVGAGFIGAYVAGTFVHPHAHELTEAAEKVLERHEQYAQWTIYASALGAVLKLVSLFLYRKKRLFEVVVFLVLGFSAYSVSEAGHYGSQLVYIEGVGPQGDYLEPEEGEHAH